MVGDGTEDPSEGDAWSGLLVQPSLDDSTVLFSRGHHTSQLCGHPAATVLSD